MVQISLFDIFSPPQPISGEAFTLSPLDVIIFTPTGAIAKTGEKVVSSLTSFFSRLFGSKATLPATTGLITVATTGARGGGAPFRLSTTVLGERASTFGLQSVITKPAISSTTNLARITNPFTGKINPNLVLGAGIAGVAGASIFQLTGTEEGREFTEGLGNFGEQLTQFATDNPLILLGVVVIAGVLVIK